MNDCIFTNCRLVQLPVKGDDRGALIALEGEGDVPFAIARVYYIFGTQPGVARGFHAHHRLSQWLISVRGACRILLDDGRSKRDVVLDRADLALEIGPMVWHEMWEFTPDSVLMVLADDHYSEADYIRDYDAFLGLARGERRP